MKIKATLQKPYTEEEYANFVVEYNHQQGFKIEETETELQAWGYTDEEETQQRQKDFYNNFLVTSKGNYRLMPKGYANAQQSIDTINGNVLSIGELDAEIAAMVIFYPTPDFTNPEQCTEEWLVQHQYNIEPMTKEVWGEFYREFSRLYALNQYKAGQTLQVNHVRDTLNIITRLVFNTTSYTIFVKFVQNIVLTENTFLDIVLDEK